MGFLGLPLGPPGRTPHSDHGGLKKVLVANNIYLHPYYPYKDQKSRKLRQIEFCPTLPIVLAKCGLVLLYLKD